MQDISLKPINEFLALLKPDNYTGTFQYFKHGVTFFNLSDKDIPSLDVVDLSLICKDFKKEDFLNILKKYYVLGIELKDNPGRYKTYQKLLDLLLARAALFNILPSELMMDVLAELKDQCPKSSDKSVENNSHSPQFFNEYDSLLDKTVKELLEIKEKSKFVFFDNEGKLVVCDTLEEAQAKCYDMLKEKIRNTNDAYTGILRSTDYLLSNLSAIVSENELSKEINRWKQMLESAYGGWKFKKFISRIKQIKEEIEAACADLPDGESRQKHRKALEMVEAFLEKYSKIVNDENIKATFGANQNLAPIELAFGAKDEWGVFKAKSSIYQVKPEFISKVQSGQMQDDVSDIYKTYSCSLEATCDLKFDRELNADIGYNIKYNNQLVLSKPIVNPQYQKVLALEQYINDLDKKYNSIICLDRENVKYKISIMKDLLVELDQLVKNNNFDFTNAIDSWKEKNYLNGVDKYQSILGHHRNLIYKAVNLTRNKEDKIQTKTEEVVNNLALK